MLESVDGWVEWGRWGWGGWHTQKPATCSGHMCARAPACTWQPPSPVNILLRETRGRRRRPAAGPPMLAQNHEHGKNRRPGTCCRQLTTLRDPAGHERLAVSRKYRPGWIAVRVRNVALVAFRAPHPARMERERRQKQHAPVSVRIP